MQERKNRTGASKLRKNAENEPHLVGDNEDLLPFAWRTPMIVDERKCSKVLRELTQEDQIRMRPPAAPKTTYHI